MSAKAQDVKEQIHKLDFIKIKNFCSTQDTAKENGNIANYISG